jgi:hypothetical protein
MEAPSVRVSGRDSLAPDAADATRTLGAWRRWVNLAGRASSPAPWLVAAALIVHSIAGAGPHRVEVGRFTAPAEPDALPAGWEPLTFRKIPRSTRYSVVRDGEGWVLKAESEAAASALYRRLELDLHAHPRLTWRWKIDNVLVKGDARRREGDDYPARVYVTFRYDPAQASPWQKAKYEAYRQLYGAYPPHAALNYIWDNRLPPGTMLDNAYTDRAKMIVVRSGAAEVGRWVTETRNVVDDYRRLFGGDPPPIAGVAVMTDTDDTAERAVAWYDALAFLAPD